MHIAIDFDVVSSFILKLRKEGKNGIKNNKSSFKGF